MEDETNLVVVVMHFRLVHALDRRAGLTGAGTKGGEVVFSPQLADSAMQPRDSCLQVVAPALLRAGVDHAMPNLSCAKDGAGRTDDDTVEVFAACGREARVEAGRNGSHPLDDDGQGFQMEVDGIAQQLFGRALPKRKAREIEIKVSVLCERMHALVGSACGVQGYLLLAELEDGLFQRRLDAFA